MTLTRSLVFALALVAVTPLVAQAFDAPQTSTEKLQSEECWARAELRLGDVLSYPLTIFAAPDADVMAVDVNPEQWEALPQPERLTLMADLACSYAGGRMRADQWQPFGAVDPQAGKTIETFTAEELFSTKTNP